MWGRGLYFATNAVYSNDYTFSGGGGKQFFLCKVLVGESINLPADNSLTMPPEKPSQNADIDLRYDSITAITSTSVNYVIYDNHRSYPAYLITYK